jgi:hypothetical protein
MFKLIIIYNIEFKRVLNYFVVIRLIKNFRGFESDYRLLRLEVDDFCLDYFNSKLCPNSLLSLLLYSNRKSRKFHPYNFNCIRTALRTGILSGNTNVEQSH